MKPLSQNNRILAALADGQEHEMRDIHRVAGFCRLNSRVSELRSRGHVITCRREGQSYYYRLVKPEPVTRQNCGDEIRGLLGPPPEPALVCVVDESRGQSLSSFALGGIPVKTDKSVEPGTVELRDGETVVAKLALTDSTAAHLFRDMAGTPL